MTAPAMRPVFEVIRTIDANARTVSSQKFTTEKVVFTTDDLRRVYRQLAIFDKNPNLAGKTNFEIGIDPVQTPLGVITFTTKIGTYPSISASTTICDAAKRFEVVSHNKNDCDVGKVRRLRSFSSRLMEKKFDYNLKKKGATFDLTITYAEG